MLKKGMWIGAVVWVIGGPFLLACNASIGMTFFQHFHQSFLSSFIVSFMFFGFATFPFTILIGMRMGCLISQWRQRNFNTGAVLIRSAVVGAGLCIFVEWASIGFLYSFGAIAKHLSILDWLTAFWPWVVTCFPLALIIGVICGIITALFIGKNIPCGKQ